MNISSSVYRFAFLIVLVLFIIPNSTLATTIKLTLIVDKVDKNYKTILSNDSHIEVVQKSKPMYYFLMYALIDGFEFQLKENDTFDVFYVNKISKLYLTSIIPSNEATQAINLKMPIHYKFENGKVICPKM